MARGGYKGFIFMGLILFFLLVVLTPFTLHYMGLVDILNPSGIAAEWEVADQNGILLKGASAPRTIFGGVSLSVSEVQPGIIPRDAIISVRPVLIHPKTASLEVRYRVAMILDDKVLEVGEGALSGQFPGGSIGLYLFSIKSSDLMAMMPEGRKAVLRVELRELMGVIRNADGSIKRIQLDNPVTLLAMTLTREQFGGLRLESGAMLPSAL
ncbi:MAG: hypothetical protein QW692_02235 [Nitrososphaerota archaeon]